MQRMAAIVGIVIGLAAVTVQGSITISLRMSAGHGLIDALVYFFTYFTILTNLMLVLIYVSTMVQWGWLGWWRSPVTRGMMAGAIVLVSVFYHFLLAGLWAPEGWGKAADVALHYANPVLYVVWWLVFQPKGRLRFRDIPLMLLPIAVWLGWVMLRGAIIGEYPYPILEAHKLGYGQVALNCLVVLVALLALFAIVVGIDRAFARRQAP